MSAAAVIAAVLAVRFVVLPRPTYSDTHGARVVHYRLAGKVLGRSLSEVAVLPPGDRRRPLLVFLHGRHDSRPWSWLIPSRSGPESVLSNEFFAALQRLGDRAPIVVLLNGGGHTYYHDRRAGRFGTAVLEDAIPDAITRFRTTDRVAIGGISMGGFGALDLGRIESKRFCAVGGHSPAIFARGSADTEFAFDDAADFAHHDLLGLARKGNPYDAPVWLDVGSDDELRPAVTNLARELRANEADVSFHVWPGSHNGLYWDAHFAQYVRFYADACD